jgi:hypothetical protein
MDGLNGVRKMREINHVILKREAMSKLKNKSDIYKKNSILISARCPQYLSCAALDVPSLQFNVISERSREYGHEY